MDRWTSLISHTLCSVLSLSTVNEKKDAAGRIRSLLEIDTVPFVVYGKKPSVLATLSYQSTGCGGEARGEFSTDRRLEKAGRNSRAGADHIHVCYP